MLRLLCRMSGFITAGHTTRLCNNRGIGANRLFPSLLRNTSASLYDIALVEEPIDFFQCQIGCLGIAEVLQNKLVDERYLILANTYDQRYEGKVERHEDQVTLPRQAVEKRRRNHNNEKVPDPIRRDTDSCTFRSHVQWEDFGYIHPWNAVHRHTKRQHVLEFVSFCLPMRLTFCLQ